MLFFNCKKMSNMVEFYVEWGSFIGVSNSYGKKFN